MAFEHVSGLISLDSLMSDRGRSLMVVQPFSQQEPQPKDLGRVQKFFLIHGLLLWFGWGVLGFLQIVSTRYITPFWKVHLWVHRGSGIIILGVTLFIRTLSIKMFGFELVPSTHSYVGQIVIFLACLVTLQGFLARFCLNFVKWNTFQALRSKYAHRFSSFFVIALSQIAILTGVIDYNDKYGRDSSLGNIHVLVFTLVLFTIEIIYQAVRKRESPYSEADTTIQYQEFIDRVQNGEQLVILDDMVLDVTKYKFNHPGGKFVIEQNIGRDVSKFFYGGYTLENYRGDRPYTHSNIARITVNSLIIGRLIRRSPQAKAKVVERTKVNDYTQTIVFRAPQPVVGIMPYYSDISMIGKHFLVRSLASPRIKRQYTVTNCMKEEVYQEYLRVIRERLDYGSNSPFNQELIQEREGTDIRLTVKNYNVKDGLSSRMFQASPDEVFLVQGPMGKGLGIQPSGTNIAFTAGTGILVFVDLVAHLVRKNLGLLNPQENEMLSDEFKFVLYASFQKREESLALGLCLGLRDICIKLGLKNFDFHLRLSIELKEKWTQSFLERELLQYQREAPLKKVWVCGPPRMNEDLDKALEKIAPKLDLSRSQYEVL